MNVQPRIRSFGLFTIVETPNNRLGKVENNGKLAGNPANHRRRPNLPFDLFLDNRDGTEAAACVRNRRGIGNFIASGW